MLGPTGELLIALAAAASLVAAIVVGLLWLRNNRKR